jgi:hypothetical protein
MQPEDFTDAPHPLAWRSRRQRWTEIGRAALLLALTVASSAMTRVAFHADALWLGWVGAWVSAFFVVLLFTLILDITERDALTTREF